MATAEHSDDTQEITVRLIGLPVEPYMRSAAHHDALRRELALIHRSDQRDLPAGLRDLVRELADLFDAFVAEPRANIERAVRERAELSPDTVDLEYTVSLRAARSAQRLLELLDDADAYCRSGDYLVTVESPAETRVLRTWVLRQFVEQAEGRGATSWRDWEDQGGAAAPGAPGPGRWTATVEGNHADVVISGELDIDVSPRLRDFFSELSSQGVADLTIDCSDVTFIDSVGLSVLIAVHRRCEEEGGGVAIINPSPVVARTLEIAGLGALFGVER